VVAPINVPTKVSGMAGNRSACLAGASGPRSPVVAVVGRRLGHGVGVVLAGVALLGVFVPGVASAARRAKATASTGSTVVRRRPQAVGARHQPDCQRICPLPNPSLPFSVAHLTGSQESSPNSSPATGFGSAFADPLPGTDIVVQLSWSGLTAPATAAEIHLPDGSAFALGGVPAATSGSIPEQQLYISQAQIAQMQAGLWYFDVHSVTFPAGEIRGQILSADAFDASLDAGQETSPHGISPARPDRPAIARMSTSSDNGMVALGSDQTFIAVDLRQTCLSGAPTGAHIHGPAPFGVAAPVLFTLAEQPFGTCVSFPEQYFSVTPAQVAQLRAGLWYFNVDSTAFPAGEIRGQLLLGEDSQGIRIAAADGQVVAFGRVPAIAANLGNLSAPIVGISDTPDYQGYWLAGSDGGVFTLGDAGFFGSLGSVHLNAPVVGMAATPDGKGYWLVGADGGVFSFGDAGFLGSLGSVHLNAPLSVWRRPRTARAIGWSARMVGCSTSGTRCSAVRRAPCT
jgi:hypothetical protein